MFKLAGCDCSIDDRMNKGTFDNMGALTSILHSSFEFNWNRAKYSASRGHDLMAISPPYKNNAMNKSIHNLAQ